MTLVPPDKTDDCGCAPTASEQRRLWPTFDRRSALKYGALGAVALGAFGAATSGFASPAVAADYPSWDDVQAAKANEAAKAGEISRTTGERISVTKATTTGLEPATSAVTGRRANRLRYGAKNKNSTPNGIRTRAAAVKGRCPRPLDDGGLLFFLVGDPADSSSGFTFPLGTI